MHRKFVTATVALATLAALVVFVFTAVRALWYAPDSEIEVPQEVSGPNTITSATSSPVKQKSEDYPVRISIPSLKIDAGVQRVGINAKGTMAVPSTFYDVAWYKYGTVPGEVGSAVIDGHVDNGLGLNGVFKHLQDISVGDDVYVSMKSGGELHFVVMEKVSYPYTSVPADSLFARSDVPRLNLVTCGGKWVHGGDTYDHRLVVYTELET